LKAIGDTNDLESWKASGFGCRVGAWKLAFEAFEQVRPNTVFRAHATTPFFHMSVLFKTGVPFGWSGLGAAKLAFGAFGPIRPNINF
jgi:hypothetical protein